MRKTRGMVSKETTVDFSGLLAGPDEFQTSDVDALRDSAVRSDDLDAAVAPLSWDDEIVRESHLRISNRAWRALSGRML